MLNSIMILCNDRWLNKNAKFGVKFLKILMVKRARLDKEKLVKRGNKMQRNPLKKKHKIRKPKLKTN